MHARRAPPPQPDPQTYRRGLIVSIAASYKHVIGIAGVEAPHGPLGPPPQVRLADADAARVSCSIRSLQQMRARASAPRPDGICENELSLRALFYSGLDSTASLEQGQGERSARWGWSPRALWGALDGD